MATQGSLLVTAGVPTNSHLLIPWAERIRDRISALSKAALNIEIEKQNLLCMLWEAGMADFIIQDSTCDGSEPSATTPYAQIESKSLLDKNNLVELSGDRTASAKTVVDLLSDDDCSRRSGGTFALPDSTEVTIPENMSCPPTPIIDELEGVNPMDLTYVRSEAEENQAPNEQTPMAPRVFHLSEHTMIDWSKVSQSELKEWAKFFGMKPGLNRSFMIAEFGRFFQYLTQIGTSTGSAAPDASESLNRRFVECIQTNPALFERILLYESVEIVEVWEFLKSEISDVCFSVKHVKDFFTYNELHFSNTAGNLRTKRGRMKEEVEEPKRTRRELRRSITCP